MTAAISRILTAGLPGVSQNAIFGALALLGGLLIVLSGVLAINDRRISKIIVQELQGPGSPLGVHKSDPNAHELMRQKHLDGIESKLEALVLSMEHMRVDLMSRMFAHQSDLLASNRAALDAVTRVQKRDNGDGKDDQL